MEMSVEQVIVTHLLGELSLKPEKITPEQWVLLISHILKQNKEQIGYLPINKPIKSVMNGWQGSMSDRPKTDMSIVSFPEDFSAETPCVFLARVSHDVEGDAVGFRAYGVKYVYEKNLYLTRKSRILLSDRKYERVFRSTGHMLGEYEQDDLTLSWAFSYCEGEMLAQICNHKVGSEIISSLGDLAARCVKERRHNLSSAEDLHNQLLYAHKMVGNVFERWHEFRD